jgi:hypothetical protein
VVTAIEPRLSAWKERVVTVEPECSTPTPSMAPPTPEAVWLLLLS